MRSMTGYGRASREADGRTLTIELKSVNHRFLDLAFRMPRSMGFLEDRMRKTIGARLARGHVDVFVTYRNLRADARKVAVDRALFGAYWQALDSLMGEGVTDDRTLLKVAGLPDVLTVTEADEDQQALTELMDATLSDALDALVAMREKEGAQLAADLGSWADALEAMTEAIEARYPETVEEYRARLKSSIQEMIGQNVDETRLLMEVAVMADRSAIAEETVRLHSHLKQWREHLASREPVGRRLDFLVQELNREVNTISSKSQDVPITRLCVDAKAEIEKLREQLQNVE